MLKISKCLNAFSISLERDVIFILGKARVDLTDKNNLGLYSKRLLLLLFKF